MGTRAVTVPAIHPDPGDPGAGVLLDVTVGLP